MHTLQQTVDRSPVSAPPFTFSRRCALDGTTVDLKAAFQKPIDVRRSRLFRSHTVLRQVREESVCVLERVSNSCLSKSFAAECHAECFQIPFEPRRRWPLPLCHPQQVMDRCGVIGSPVVLIMRRSSMARTIFTALPAQVMLQIRWRYRLHRNVLLREIAKEHAGHAHMILNGAGIQVLGVRKMVPEAG